jgi:hypothetical protein
MKDIEYMVTQVGGDEGVVYSSDVLKEVAKFLRMTYEKIKYYSCTKKPFKFENRYVQIEKIDMNADYGI